MRHNSLAYQVSGTDVHGTIMAFHGVTDSAASISDISTHYGADWRVITVDNLGHGLSSRFSKDELDDPFSALVRAGSSLVYQMARQTPEGKVVLMGHSLGGAISTYIAKALPQYVRALILEDPALLTKDLAKMYKNEAANLVDRQYFVRQYMSKALEELQISYPNWPLAEYLGWAQAKTQVDLDFLSTGIVGALGRNILSELSVPTLLLTGDGSDVLFSEQDLQDVRDLGNKNIETAVITKASHTVRRDNPCEFYRKVDAFLEKQKNKTPGSIRTYLDAQLAPYIELTPKQTTWKPRIMREEGEKFLQHETPTLPGIEREIIKLNGVENRIISARGQEAQAVVLAIHGGGYVAGIASFDDARNMEIVAQCRHIIISSPEYRLAPEHPYPAGLQDCINSLEALKKRYPGIPIFLYGDSAGGGLANQMLQTPGIAEKIAGIISLEPCLDPDLQTLSYKRYKLGPIWTREAAGAAWQAYLGKENQIQAYWPAKQLTDFPPILVFVNPIDPLRDEGIAWALSLIDAGAKVQMHMYPGTFHGSLSILQTKVWEQVKAQVIGFMEEIIREHKEGEQ